jgi:hypothetical protein
MTLSVGKANGPGHRDHWSSYDTPDRHSMVLTTGSHAAPVEEVIAVSSSVPPPPADRPERVTYGVTVPTLRSATLSGTGQLISG